MRFPIDNAPWRTARARLALDDSERMAAAWIGLLMAVLTLLLYVPILAMASQSTQALEGINYVADTLLYAGAALLVAGALPENPPLGGGSRPQPAQQPTDHAFQ